MESNRLVTYRDATEMLSVCTRTVRKLVETGKLRRVKIGSAVRIPLRDIEKYIEGGGDVPAVER